MKMTYDPKYNIAYIRFQQRMGSVTTLKLSDEINLDIGEDGSLYGIELLNANKQLEEDKGRLVVESMGQRHEIAVTA